MENSIGCDSGLSSQSLVKVKRYALADFEVGSAVVLGSGCREVEQIVAELGSGLRRRQFTSPE